MGFFGGATKKKPEKEKKEKKKKEKKEKKKSSESANGSGPPKSIPTSVTAPRQEPIKQKPPQQNHASPMPGPSKNRDPPPTEIKMDIQVPVVEQVPQPYNPYKSEPSSAQRQPPLTRDQEDSSEPQQKQPQHQPQQQLKKPPPPQTQDDRPVAPQTQMKPPPQAPISNVAPEIPMMRTPQSPLPAPGTEIAAGINQTTSVRKEPENAATVEVTRDLVKRFISDIWNRGEIELIPRVCHPSLRFNGHVGMDRVGHEGFSRMVSTVRDALTDYHCEIHSMVVETNKAFCRLRFTGKHTGNLLGYPPTGKTVAWMGASEFTCKNGKILKVWELGDVKSLEEQLKNAE